MKIGDRVLVLMHSRCKGVIDTGGGWTSDWVDGTIRQNQSGNSDKYTRICIMLLVLHQVPFKRIRRMEERNDGQKEHDL